MDREESAPRETFLRFADDVLQLCAPGSVTVDVEAFEASVDSYFVEGPAEQRRTPPSAAVSSRQIAVDSSIAVTLVVPPHRGEPRRELVEGGGERHGVGPGGDPAPLHLGARGGNGSSSAAPSPSTRRRSTPCAESTNDADGV